MTSFAFLKTSGVAKKNSKPNKEAFPADSSVILTPPAPVGGGGRKGKKLFF